MVLRKDFLAAVLSAVALFAAAPAAAQSEPEVVGPYDGSIPFLCELQSVGTGTDFPHPEADPFCVEFDKTNQNVTDFGLIEFTAQEPARVAAASTKCFYFQRDHWTGSVVQGSAPEAWHWDGDYWFDRARGVGGVSVKNFRVGGQPQDASPYAPEAYRPYFDENGGGGVLVKMESGPDPSCAAKVDTPAERDLIYGNRGLYPPCIEPGGELRGKRVGRVRLGMSRKRVLSKLGPPLRSGNRVDRWCLVGKGELRIAYGPRKRALAILTSSRGHSIDHVSRGDRLRRARRRLDIVDEVEARHRTRILIVEASRHRKAWVGVRERRVRWVMIYKRGLDATTAARLIRHVR
jgi:hypothetical protein